MQTDTRLVFIKLGGSLITDKDIASTARPEVLLSLCRQLRRALDDMPGLRILLGHGSGSFGHAAAEKANWRRGEPFHGNWTGYRAIWQAARALNHLVLESLQQAGVPALAFPPSASVIAERGTITRWDIEPLEHALAAGMVPVVYGDIVFDNIHDAAILSTENLFVHLAGRLRPQRILLAGITPGVCSDFPDCRTTIPEITPAAFPALESIIHGSGSTDVTGGMVDKVRSMLALVQNLPGLEVMILDGRPQDALYHALQGHGTGTRLHT